MKLLLEEAGLGEKMLEVPVSCSPEEFHDTILTAYPKLQEGGGFELLRCMPNSRDLVPIGTRVAGTPKLLKRRVGNGRVYIRPLQRELSLDPEELDEDMEVSVYILCIMIAAIMYGGCLLLSLGGTEMSWVWSALHWCEDIEGTPQEMPQHHRRGIFFV